MLEGKGPVLPESMDIQRCMPRSRDRSETVVEASKFFRKGSNPSEAVQLSTGTPNFKETTLRH